MSVDEQSDSTLTTADSPRPTNSNDGTDARGPFRPEQLITARARQGGRLAAHAFRLVDLISISIVSTVVIVAEARGAVRDAPLSLVAPVFVGAVVTARVMRSTHQYRFGRQEPMSLHESRVAAAVAVGGGLALIVGSLVESSDDPARVPLRWVLAMLITLVPLHAAWWVLVRRWRTAGRLTPNVVIVGATSHAQQLIDEALQRRGVNVLGVFDDRLARAPQAIFGVPVLGDTDALLSHHITPFVDRIVVAVDPSARSRVKEITDRLAALPNEVVLMVDDEQGGRSDALNRLADAPLAPLDVEDDPDRRAFAKRLQDILLGGLALIASAPVLAVIALIVRVDSRGPVFFRQRRHGFNNEEIVVWKFRSMRDEARDERAERQVTADDDRVTRVGRILRKTSLDELPQLLNVLGGEMSLVGPRPHAIGMKTGDTEAAQLVSDYAKRHRMKPGMTGLAAVRGSRGPLHTAAEVRHRVALDVEYIERQTFWLDVWILAVDGAERVRRPLGDPLMGRIETGC